MKRKFEGERRFHSLLNMTESFNELEGSKLEGNLQPDQGYQGFSDTMQSNVGKLSMAVCWATFLLRVLCSEQHVQLV